MKWSGTLLLVAAALVLQCFEFEKSTNSPTGLPILTTSAVLNIGPTNAECGRTITSEGKTAVTERGVCYSENRTPTVADTKSLNGSGPGTFICAMAGLKSNTVYYVRAYATNSIGTGYGEILSFTTTSL